MKANRKDFIFDMETLGPRVMHCPVVDMAYTTFEWDRFIKNPYTFQELATNIKVVKLCVKDQVDNYGCKFTKKDVEWWETLPKFARDKLKRTPEDLTVVEFCDTILKYLRDEVKIDYWWSRGNTFDPVIIGRLMDQTDNEYLFNEYLKFHKVRDVRTHIDAKFDYSTKNGFVPITDVDYWHKYFVEHNSSHDVAADVMRLQAIHRGENDMEQVNR
jgi:hypothetical protein